MIEDRRHAMKLLDSLEHGRLGQLAHRALSHFVRQGVHLGDAGFAALLLVFTLSGSGQACKREELAEAKAWCQRMAGGDV